MIVDAAEAASRSMPDPIRSKFEKMIQLIIVKRMNDGQFSECDLTTRDISQIKDVLLDALEASFHSRIQYPWQEKEKAKNGSRWRFGSGEREKETRRSFKL